MHDLDERSEAEKFGDLAAGFAAMARKVAAQAESDKMASEMLDLAARAEAMAVEMVRRKGH